MNRYLFVLYILVHMKNFLKPFSNSSLCKNILILIFSTLQFNERNNIKSCNNLFKTKILIWEDLPLFGFGNVSCKWNTTLSIKKCMSVLSAPRTNNSQSWVNPSGVRLFLTDASWPISKITLTYCKNKIKIY